MCVVDYSALLFINMVAEPLAIVFWAFLLYKLIAKSLRYKMQQAMSTLKAEVLG